MGETTKGNGEEMSGEMPNYGDLQARLDETEEERDKAYRERARLVAFLAAVYPAELTPAESDSGAWWLVFVSTPAGQMSWHLHEDDLELFEPLLNKPETGVTWDGHTTEEKYERLAELTSRHARAGGIAGVVAAAVLPVGYQGAAAHTFTTGCDGFHPIGEQCNLPAATEPGQ